MRKKAVERFDVFLSHNSEDKAEVKLLGDRLTDDGVKVWIDRSELYGGDALPVTLKSALTNSAACAVFVGKHGVGPWQQKEIDVATKLKFPKRRVIPVFLPDAGNELPPVLGELMWLRFSSLDEVPKYQQLLGSIREKIRDRNKWDWIRKSLIAAGVVVPLVLFAWALVNFFTFQAQFATPSYEQQQSEVIITRRFNPFGYRLCTSVFASDLTGAGENALIDRCQLNLGMTPNWNRLLPVLSDKGIVLAEIKWLDREVTSPNDILVYHLDGWGRASPSVVDGLLSLLNAKDVQIRSDASVSLLRLEKHQKAAINVLVGLLTDQDDYTRSNAAETLGQWGRGNAEVIDALVALLTDDEVDVRRAAAEALVQLERSDPDVIDALVALAVNPDRETSSHALENLVIVAKRDPSAIDALLKLRWEEDEFVRSQAIAMLGKLGKVNSAAIDALVSRLGDPDFSVRYDAWNALVELGKETDTAVVTTLYTLLDDPDRYVRHDALDWLVQLGKSDAAVIDRLVTVINNGDELFNVRASAAQSLGNLGKSDPTVIGALDALLKDPSVKIQSDVRISAVLSLVKLGRSDQPVIDELVSRLGSGDCADVASAADSLVTLKKSDKPVVDAIVALLGRSDIGLHYIAEDTLGKMGASDVKVFDRLIEMLESPDANVCFHAVRALLTSGKADAAIVDRLVPFHKDANWQVRKSVAECLGELDRSDVVVAFLKDQNSYVRLSAAETLVKLGNRDSAVIETLVALLGDEDAYVRRDAVNALSLSGTSDPAVINGLVTLAKSSRTDSVIADGNSPEYEAAEYLVLLAGNDDAVMSALIPHLKDLPSFQRGYAAELWSNSRTSGAKIIEAQFVLLSDQLGSVRSQAAKALGRMGKSDVAVIDRLVPLLIDHDDRVREETTIALGNIGQKRDDWKDEQLIADLADFDSGIRERAGIVLAWRDEKLNPQTVEKIKTLRNDSRPWVRQASLHSLYHIEKRKAELAEESRTTAEQPAAKPR